MCLTAPWDFLLDSLPVMLQTDMRLGSRNCVLPHALKLTKTAIHAGNFWGGSDALFNNRKRGVCNNSSNQMAQQESTDGSLTQATAHICDQTTKDLLWRGVVRPAICTKGNTEHCTCDYVTTHTHIYKHTLTLTDVCLCSCSVLKYPTSLIRFPPLGTYDCTLTSQWPGNECLFI